MPRTPTTVTTCLHRRRRMMRPPQRRYVLRIRAPGAAATTPSGAASVEVPVTNTVTSPERIHPPRGRDPPDRVIVTEVKQYNDRGHRCGSVSRDRESSCTLRGRAYPTNIYLTVKLAPLYLPPLAATKRVPPHKQNIRAQSRDSFIPIPRLNRHRSMSELTKLVVNLSRRPSRVFSDGNVSVSRAVLLSPQSPFCPLYFHR